MKFRIGVFTIWEAVCVHAGGFSGLFWGAIAFGLACVLWYAVTDTWKAVTSPRTVTYNQTLNVDRLEAPARTEDPTRPRTDDFAGMIEYRKERNG